MHMRKHYTVAIVEIAIHIKMLERICYAIRTGYTVTDKYVYDCKRELGVYVCPTEYS